MDIKFYWKYLKYVLEHKKNVFVECWKDGLYSHAFTHDLSKFNPKEFFPYAEWFYGYDGIYLKKQNNKEQLTNGASCVSKRYLECKKGFDKAWQHHKDKNKHHWNYWHERNLIMPVKYIRQMICDWKAMSRKFGGTVQEYYLKNYDKIKLEKDSRLILEELLDLNFKKCCECDEIYWMTVREIIDDCIEYKKINPEQYCDILTKEWINNINIKYNLDLLKILGYKEKQISKPL